MIKCFEQELRGIIISEVKQAKFFSVMADECSDVANKEQLAIVIRYVNPINPGLLALELTMGEVFSTPPPAIKQEPLKQEG